MHRLGKLNGLLDNLPNFNVAGAVLPGTRIPVLQFRTGSKDLDEYLSFMVALFHVDLDSNNIKAHVQGLHFLGTLTATWFLMIGEAHRAGSSSSFLIATYVMFFVGELAGLGVWIPLWCLLHLVTSKTVTGARNPGQEHALSVRPADVAPLPLALILGFGLPTALMISTDPAGSPLWSQQTWVLIRLLHPLLALAVWGLLRSFLGAGSKQTAVGTVRHLYSWGILIATFSHLLALAPLLMSYRMPAWLASGVAKGVEARGLFIPTPFWTSNPPKITSFAEGVSIFLQWDEMLTATAITFWAFVVYLEGTRHAPGLGWWEVLKVSAQGLGYSVIAGPAAAAVFFIQERDINVFSGPTTVLAKKTQ